MKQELASIDQSMDDPRGATTERDADVVNGPRLWIDLDNSPHVPLFAPLVRHLRQQGWNVLLTARDFAQTLDLVEQFGLDAIPVGAHAGKNKALKVANLPIRAMQLTRVVRRFKPDAALSHGSRTQALASRLMGVPQIVMFDYEWTELRILSTLATRLLCPAALTSSRLHEVGVPVGKVSWYDGFKEELYLGEFEPDPCFRASLGVSQGERLVTIRPPGIIGNYHDPRSEELCAAAIRHVLDVSDAVAVILPKTRLERAFVDSILPTTPRGRVIIPERALPGLQLLYASDLAISGGGTMNRESALLGTPTWSIFTGRRAMIDDELARRGRLSFAETVADVESIEIHAGQKKVRSKASQSKLLYELSDTITTFVTSSSPRYRISDQSLPLRQ